jgi:hypothetical protein
MQCRRSWEAHRESVSGPLQPGTIRVTFIVFSPSRIVRAEHNGTATTRWITNVALANLRGGLCLWPDCSALTLRRFVAAEGVA